MADALTYIATKYNLTLSNRPPIEIPNTGRADLARLFYLLEFRRGVEIGVEQGLFSEVLCRQNPLLHLSCVDPWKAYRGYRDHVDQAKLDRFFAAATERLAPFRATLIRKFSVDAARDFKDGELDFVYIDGNHRLEAVIADLAAWAPKVRRGGIIAGHDFVKYRHPNMIHVVEAVRAYTDAYQIHPWFVLGSNAKVDGEVRDTARSFFWVHDPKPLSRRRIKQ